MLTTLFGQRTESSWRTHYISFSSLPLVLQTRETTPARLLTQLEKDLQTRCTLTLQHPLPSSWSYLRRQQSSSEGRSVLSAMSNAVPSVDWSGWWMENLCKENKGLVGIDGINQNNGISANNGIEGKILLWILTSWTRMLRSASSLLSLPPSPG